MSDFKNFPVLKEKISELENLLANAMMKNSEMSEDNDNMIRNQLDDKGYYIKEMPKDCYVLFRCFSDALYFSQSRYMEVKASLASFIQRNSNLIDKFLKERQSEKPGLDIITDLIFLCEIYK